jgi:anthranilate synthase component 1
MNLPISFVEFSKKSQKHNNFIISQNISCDFDTVISLYAKLKDLSDHSLLFESAETNKNKARYSIIALIPDLIWSCQDELITLKNGNDILYSKTAIYSEIIKSLEKLQTDSKFAEDTNLPPGCSGIFGYMGYDMVRYFENTPQHQIDELKIPDAIFIRPQILIIFDHLKDEIILNIPIWSKNKDLKKLYKTKAVLYKKILSNIGKAITNHQNIYDLTSDKKIKFNSNFSQKSYEDTVKKAQKYIVDGDIFQILPSRRFYSDFPYEGFNFYRVLRNLNPSPFLFYLNFKDFEVIGSSPEIMVRVSNNQVTIRPLAGTRKRGLTHQQDKQLSADLLSDEKEIAEHLMLIDLGRNDIGRVSRQSSVQVSEYMKIEYYSHVMHISSTVIGELLKDKTCLDALIAGFPAGTVSGAPKIRAMEIIAKLEPITRSFYSGCVGYFSLHQKYMDTAIMLRTGLIKDSKLYLQSGAGIVHDSIPKSEYEETESKAQILFKAANIAANIK